jgi:hypothetical protein
MEVLGFGLLAAGVQLLCRGLDQDRQQEIETLQSDIQTLGESIAYFKQVGQKDTVEECQRALTEKVKRLEELS